MMCKPLDFEIREHKELVNRIIDGEAVLFLGSGFSQGSVGSYRDEETGNLLPLPDASELKQILLRKVLYTDETEESLKVICEDCQEDVPMLYAKVMRELFTVSTIQEFQKMYADINWKAVFTTNVDNVLEKAYQEREKNLICVYTKDPVNARRGELMYYKLHGDAVHKPEDIVFSTTDYVTNSASSHDYRFEKLSADLKTDNFVFIGTSLNEEWDFDIQCRQANIYQITNKTYFIVRDDNSRLIKRIRRKFNNVVFIRETAESFIYKVRNYILQNPVKHSDSVFTKWKFQWIQRQNYEVASYLKPDLYVGAEPTWQDILSNHDVIWENTERALQQFRKETDKACTLIVGRPISGKSTLLYRLGAEFCDERMVLEYIGDDLDDITDCLNYLNEQGDPALILLDDANWILGRIGTVVNLLEKGNSRLVMSVNKKEFMRRQHLFEGDINNHIIWIESSGHLSSVDIGRYLDKLNEKSFLGRYSKDYKESRDSAVKKLKKEIYKKKEDPLLRLAYKKQFGDELDRRISELSEAITRNDNYNVKRLAVLLYLLDVIGGMGLRLSFFLDLYPMDPEMLEEFVPEIQNLMVSNINQSSWKRTNYGKITIHARLSEILRKAVGRIRSDELKNLTVDVFRRLDEVYHFKCRQPNTYQNYVLYTLLRSQNIRELFNSVREKQLKWGNISSIYEELHECFGDYYLYWLHRGISEIKMGEYLSAEIHLQQADAIRIGYSYEIEHTFAILYFEKAIHSDKLPYSERKDLYERGLKIIRSQMDMKTNDAFTIHSFIKKTIEFYNNCGKMIPDDLMKEILSCYYIARKRFDLNHSIIRRDMLGYIYDYLDENNCLYNYGLRITQEELAYLSQRIKDKKINIDILDMFSGD